MADESTTYVSSETLESLSNTDERKKTQPEPLLSEPPSNLSQLTDTIEPKEMLSTLLSSDEQTKKEAINQASEDFLKMLAAYRKKFGEEKKDEKGNVFLQFPSPAAADKFFEEQAQEGTKFMLLQVDGKGPTGNYAFSTGDGTCYRGKVDPSQIKEIRDAMAGWEKTQDPQEKKEFEKILLKGVSESQVKEYNQKNSISPTPPKDEVEQESEETPKFEM